MDFAFFESLSNKDAQELLSGFLNAESTAVECMRPDAERAGLRFDFSLESLPDVLKWFLSRVSMIRVPRREDAPDWIRATYSDDTVAEFDEESKDIVLRAAYYLGATFVQASPQLSWNTANRETIQQNMPVVTGFQHGIELAPMLVTENLFSSVVGDGKPVAIVDWTIQAWCKDLP